MNQEEEEEEERVAGEAPHQRDPNRKSTIGGAASNTRGLAEVAEVLAVEELVDIVELVEMVVQTFHLGLFK